MDIEDVLSTEDYTALMDKLNTNLALTRSMIAKLLREEGHLSSLRKRVTTENQRHRMVSQQKNISIAKTFFEYFIAVCAFVPISVACTFGFDVYITVKKD